jgi:hypothetical protein
MKSIRLPRLLVALALAGASLVGGSAGASAGTANTVEFVVTIGDCVIHGTATLETADSFRLIVRDAHDQLKARVDVDVSNDGFWNAGCIAGGPIKVGDRLRARLPGGSFIHLFVVPKLTIAVDRVTDVISGVGPANGQVGVAVQQCVPGGYFCAAGLVDTVPTGPDGSYSHDASALGDIDGWGAGAVRWVESVPGDAVQRFGRAPYLVVAAGSAVTGGLATPGVAVHVQLRRHGQVRATGSAVPGSPEGAWQATFRHDGHPVPVKVGDRITSDLAPDADLAVRAISIAADLGADTATGRCLPDGLFTVRFFRPDGTERVGAREYGLADAGGDFTLAGLWFLKHGWSMRLLCTNAAGDTLRRTVAVP